eukprot:CAMPEP_0170748540 /NCGR_PEP_ID=MMETSP0437-20130122/9918_1 /TAXON_ID=0 /ORGANISM="Sexangularia sp." /LENGTH=227 /DNA_ID=CAMNT_0011087407 /DNA_START=106 /DNA_END=789 /DNA_ORIENTATION=-
MSQYGQAAGFSNGAFPSFNTADFASPPPATDGQYGNVSAAQLANITLLDSIPDSPGDAFQFAVTAANNAVADGTAGGALTQDPNYVSNNVPLFPFTYFHGKINRQQADDIMGGQPRGAFLIRNSVSIPGSLAVVRKADESSTATFLLEPSNGGFVVPGEPENRFYNTILDFLEIYKVRLRIPVDRANAMHFDPVLRDFDQKQNSKGPSSHYGAPPQVDNYGATPSAF